MFVPPHVRRILHVCAATHFGVIGVHGIIHVAARTCVAAHVCCSVLQCVAVWCSVLQCISVAARTRMIPARSSCGCTHICDFLTPQWDGYN